MELLRDSRAWKLKDGKRAKLFSIRQISFFFLGLGSFLICAAKNFSARAQSPQEYKLKAAYLYNFIQFIDWPPDAFENQNSPLVIGVLGRDPFGSLLDETVQGESVKNRKIEVQRFKNLKEIKTCHVLFISASEATKFPAIVAALKGRSILTVSEAQGFTSGGGMIRFVTDKNKIRFRINLAAARQARLMISAKLLQLAESVRDEPLP